MSKNSWWTTFPRGMLPCMQLGLRCEKGFLLLYSNAHYSNKVPIRGRESHKMRRSRSGLHTVGVDEAPGVQEINREAPDVKVQPLTMDLVAGLTQVHNEGFGSKRCCCCCPVADTDGRIEKYYRSHPKRLSACGIAVGRMTLHSALCSWQSTQ